MNLSGLLQSYQMGYKYFKVCLKSEVFDVRFKEKMFFKPKLVVNTRETSLFTRQVRK